jgi:selenide,water dikinase
MAVAILGWPIDKLPPAMAQRVLEGARFMCRMAGIPLAGGHSINSTEPIFGLAVTGEVNVANLKKNNTAQEGDLLYITKPLGVGIVSTAAKRGLAKQADIDEATSYMCTLNKLGEQLGAMPGITALTDITGFGLLGHLIEMADGSELSATINFDHVPVLPCVKDYLASFIYPDMTMKSYAANASKVTTLNANQLLTLCDPQTSGGLLVAVRPEHQAAFEQVARDFGLQGIADKPIGKMTSKAEKTVTVN